MRATVRRFLQKECPSDKQRQWHRNAEYPHELFAKMAQAGWFGVPMPQEYGGAGGGVMEMVVLGEELGYFGYDIASGYGATVFCGLNLARHGSEEQKRFYIPRAISGELRFSIAITEPGAGSDAAAITTYAAVEGDHFVINGEKRFCSGAGLPNTIIQLYARTDRTSSKHEGLSLILLDPNTHGVRLRRLDTFGRRMFGTYEVFLEDVRVPRQNLVGKLNQGWNLLLSGLEVERLFVCANYVGGIQRIIDEAVEYAQQRKQFGRPIGSFQAIAHAWADLQTKADAARLLTYRAAWLAAKGVPCIKEVAMAKLFGSETYVEASRWGLQTLGGIGYVCETDMALHYVDAAAATITAGSSQMQRNIIAGKMGLKVL